MIVISNSSPLIALSAVDQLYLLQQLFTTIYIPEAVYQETVQDNHVVIQKTRIKYATQIYLRRCAPKIHQLFARTLGAGEQGVLNLALEMHPDIILLDDKKARREAHALGFMPAFTADLLKWAEAQQLIPSYHAIVAQLAQQGIYLPE